MSSKLSLFLRKLELFTKESGQIPTKPMWVLPDGDVLVVDEDDTVHLEAGGIPQLLDSLGVYGIAIVGRGDEPNRFGTIRDICGQWPPPEVKGHEILPEYNVFLEDLSREQGVETPVPDVGEEGYLRTPLNQEDLDRFGPVETSPTSALVESMRVDVSRDRTGFFRAIHEYAINSPNVEMYGMTGVRIRKPIVYTLNPNIPQDPGDGRVALLARNFVPHPGEPGRLMPHRGTLTSYRLVPG